MRVRVRVMVRARVRVRARVMVRVRVRVSPCAPHPLSPVGVRQREAARGRWQGGDGEDVG